MQVLHHISSMARRVVLLQQLAGLLVPGGRALVTAWATLQDEPGKLAKWEAIPSAEHLGAATSAESSNPQASSSVQHPGAPAAGCATPLQAAHDLGHAVLGAQPPGQAAGSHADCRSGSNRQASGSAATEGPEGSGPVRAHRDRDRSCSVPLSSSGSPPAVQGPAGTACAAQDARLLEGCEPQQLAAAARTGNDYFVPWHLPLHRVEAAAALKGAASATGGVLDHSKGTVVFKRYYHLFEEGELEGLVQRVPGVRLEESFWDKGNWCCIFCRL